MVQRLGVALPGSGDFHVAAAVLVDAAHLGGEGLHRVALLGRELRLCFPRLRHPVAGHPVPRLLGAGLLPFAKPLLRPFQLVFQLQVALRALLSAAGELPAGDGADQRRTLGDRITPLLQRRARIGQRHLLRLPPLDQHLREVPRDLAVAQTLEQPLPTAILLPAQIFSQVHINLQRFPRKELPRARAGGLGVHGHCAALAPCRRGEDNAAAVERYGRPAFEAFL